MNADRIAELIKPYLGAEAKRLTPGILSNISMYVDILQRWNSRVNLTAIRDEEEIVTRHFGESLFVASHLLPLRIANSPLVTGLSVADVGSGAGFPGIPIKFWAPEISLTLIESNHKKATFLKEVARALTLTNVNIQAARAETLAPSSFDVVTLRAVERFESILPIAARLMAPRGRLALLIGSTQLPTAKSILPRLTWVEPLTLPGSVERVLAIGSTKEPSSLSPQ